MIIQNKGGKVYRFCLWRPISQYETERTKDVNICEKVR